MKHCDNCNKDFDSNYCPDCGLPGKDLSERNEQKAIPITQTDSRSSFSAFSFLTAEEIARYNKNRKRKIRIIVVSIVGIALVGLLLFFAFGQSFLPSKINPEGVYAGNQQSVIVLRADGTGDYCYENSRIYENDLSWQISDSKIKIYSSSLGYNIYLPIDGTKANARSLITSDSAKWVKESFVKTSSSPINLTKASASQIINEYYGSLVHNITKDSIEISIPADFVMTKNNLFSYKNDSFIYFSSGSVPSSVSTANTDTALEQISSLALSALNITGQYQSTGQKTITLTGFSKRIYAISCTNWNHCCIITGYNSVQNTCASLVYVSKGEEKNLDFFSADASFLFDRLDAVQSSYTPPSKDDSNVSSDLKSMLAEYEAFIDEYVAFMKNYKKNPYDLSLLNKYSTMLTRYQTLTDKINALDQKNMSAQDLLLYSEVLNRCAQKVASVLY